MTENEKKDELELKLDALLRKYLSVWLWSILFGGVTTLTFSLVNIRDYEKWGALTTVTGMLLAVSIIFLIIAWMTLFQFLKSYLIETVFVGREEDNHEKREKYGKYLSMSFYALIVAGILRLMIELSKQIFQIF